MLVAVCTFCGIGSAAGNSAPIPDAYSTYLQLRGIVLSGEVIGVENLSLKRDAATFHLRSGTLCFVTPVQGKVTGAVFVGDGIMVLDPPLQSEAKSLKLLTREDEFVEKFNHLVLRFTDTTYEEIKKAGSAASGGCDSNLLKDTQVALRKNAELHYNLAARILEDVLGTNPGGLFVAFVPGKKYSGKLIYEIDPHGAKIGSPAVAPEEVELLTYDENKYGIWAAFHLTSEYGQGIATGTQKNWIINIENEQLDTEIEKNGFLTGKAITTISAVANGVRVLPFNLFPSLRVQNVTGENGQPLAFIQEDKNDDPQFFVILPKPLASGEKYVITTVYSGNDAVANEGNGNYYPIARLNWYPNSADTIFGNYATYDMTFRIPKGMKIAATGVLSSDHNEKDFNVTHWTSTVPQVVAGFNFGKFKMEEAKLNKPEFLVQSYANQEPPSWVRGVQEFSSSDLPKYESHVSEQHQALGTMNTTVLSKKALAEAELAIQIYTNYFGPLPYKQLAVTQQTASDYGQSWPGLVYLPITYFFDSTTRHALVNLIRNRCPSCYLRGDDPYGYFKVVAPHEVAHQWWGHEVGFNSYRDQWMSEGFANLSASLYLQAVYSKEPQRFISFWNDQRALLLQRDKEGFRPIDVGPLTMGYRLNNARAGFNIAQDLIYPKGAYILHMIRMMMWDHITGDRTFKETMQDFAHTYAGRCATTEDFKAIVEKHMTPEMATFGGGTMDWFFNEYVYGTALPSYNIQYSFDSDSSGDAVFSFKVTQSNVNGNFRMLVPIYLELADGRVVQFERVRMIGNSSVEQTVPLKGVKAKPRHAALNHNDDVLAWVN